MARSVGVMNEEEARELALRELGSDSFVITDSKRIGRTWVINYQSREYVETGNVLYMESGPGPIFVSDSGHVMRGPVRLDRRVRLEARPLPSWSQSLSNSNLD